MEVKIKRPTVVDVRFLTAVLPTRTLDQLFYEFMYEDAPLDWCGKQYTSIDDLAKDYPEVFISKDKEYYLRLKIDVDTNKVVNWPKDCPLDFYNIKVVDEGMYALLDDMDYPIVSYQGYVPDCLGQGGYGDYLEFEIDKDGDIIGVCFDQEDLEAFFEEAEKQ